VAKNKQKTYLVEVGCWARLDDAINSLKAQDREAVFQKETARSFKVTTTLPETKVFKTPYVYEANEI